MADLMANISNANIMKDFSSKISIGSFNQDMLDFRNIDSLDNFANQLDDSESSEMLKGVVTKIQNGDQIMESDFAGMTGGDLQFARDLETLTNKNHGQGIQNTRQVVDGFSDLLGNYLDNVSNTAKEAEIAVETFATGGDINVHTVMIAAEKSGLQMQLAMQMKNKIIQAYQQIQQIRV